MKTLYLLRHAKSSWDDPALDDFDRPLAPRGRAAAPRIGAFMRAAGWLPDVVLCSAARRARETWALVADALDAEIETIHTGELFHGSPFRLLTVLRRAPDSAASIALVGHSPGIENLAARLSGPGSDVAGLDLLCGKFPTAALAVIELNAERWDAVEEGGGRLIRFVRPRDLG